MQSHNRCCTQKDSKKQGSFNVRLQCSARLDADQEYASAPRVPNQTIPPTREKLSHKIELQSYRWNTERRGRACSQIEAHHQHQQRAAPPRSQQCRPQSVPLRRAHQYRHITWKGSKEHGGFKVRLQCSACLDAHQEYDSAPRVPNQTIPPTREKPSHKIEVHPYRW